MKKIVYLLIALSTIFLTGSKAFATTTYTVTFYPPTAMNWPNGGTVTSDPAGIDCGSQASVCSATFDAGTSVTLTASSDSGYYFHSFSSNPCSGTDGQPSCTFTLNGDVKEDALWGYTAVNLHMSFAGTGSGTVTASSGSLSCSTNCSKEYAVPQTASGYATVRLTATPASGSVFAGWQTSGTACFNGGGRGDPTTVNTSSTCDWAYDSTSAPSYTVVPQFNKISSTATTPHAASSPSSTQTTTSSTTSGSNAITLPTTTGLTLWNGTNFGVAGQNLSASSSSATVGIAEKDNTPLATVEVDLTKAQDWAQAPITYGVDSKAHKSFAHGLTTAPGVVGGTFTLYVPYADGDKYVGICPGAASLSSLQPSCPHGYSLMNGQKKTNSDTSSIPKGDTVTASIESVNGAKYWVVSGLTGTGGFSSASTITTPAGNTALDKNAHTTSNGLFYIVSTIFGLLVIGVVIWLKFWLPKHRSKN